VTRYAPQRGVCRPGVDRQAAGPQQTPGRQQQAPRPLRARLRDLEQPHTDLPARLRRAVVLDADKRAQFASAAPACGASWPVCWQLWDVPLPGQRASAAARGGAAQAAGRQAGPLLPPLGARAPARVRGVAAAEAYVQGPVPMAVEPESLCRPGGRLGARFGGGAWAQERGPVPHPEQVTRGGGPGPANGVAWVKARRQAQGQPALVDQGEHFHAPRGGGGGVRQAERPARRVATE
jgi:hypothetical protein